MSTRRWLGQAKDVKQVDSIVVANTWATNDTITMTIAGIDFVVTVGSLTTTAQVALTIKEAFMGTGSLTDPDATCSPTMAQGGAQAIPHFSGITATISSASTSTVLLTGDTAGIPFTLTCTESTAGTGTATLSNTTAATGKKFFDNPDNWSASTVPVDNDTIVFCSGSIDCCYGLATGIQPAQVVKLKTYTGKIGLAETNTDDSSNPYPEYRAKYLQFDDNTVTTTYFIEQGDGTGSSLIRIDAGAGQVIWNSYGSGSRFITGQPCALFLGTNAANVINCNQGDLGIAFFPDEVSTVVALRVGNGTTTGATVVCGTGVTHTSDIIDIAGGTLTLNSATTSSSDIDISGGGSLYIWGTGGHINIDVRDGSCYYRSTGTLATLAVQGDGTFDVSGDLRGATITNVVNLYPGATFHDPHGVLTLSAGFKVNGGSIGDVTVDNGVNRTYTPS